MDGAGRRRVQQPGDYDIDDLIKPHALEERVYRMRCVEGWSMVIPWVGFPLGDLIKRFEPTPRAKFVEFTTLNDSRQMPGVRSPVLNWPYRRRPASRRGDAPAHHPRRRPLRRASCPTRTARRSGWSCRGSTASRESSRSSASDSSSASPSARGSSRTPGEYGFYSNVNPEVDHPRWSQATERRIGEFFKRKTLMFNGYADQVAGLYAGMDLRKNF